MDKKIPLAFNVVISSPLKEISPALPNVSRAKCHVFTKYRNRNYSYITDEIAEKLIISATQGTTPVVGFFDKETGDFTGHAGPELASVYGYVEGFLGWEKVVDPADHIEREYATFSVVLFSDYLEAARGIVGKAQSMELDPATVAGEWTTMDGDSEYFVYSNARMKAFCVLGSGVEACFSGSAFFSKDDGTYFEQFSKLLMDLQDKVKQFSGGQNAMDEQILNSDNPTEESEQEQAPAQDYEQLSMEFEAYKASSEEKLKELADKFDALVAEKEALQATYEEMKTNYEAQQQEKTELSNQYAAQAELLANRDATIAEQASCIATYENAEKDRTIEKFSKCLPSDILSPIVEKKDSLSIEDLNTRLALEYTQFSMARDQGEQIRVPQVHEESPSKLATILNKYKK